MRNVCIEDGAGWWDARSPGVRDELHTSASDRLSRCVTEETLVTCLRIITLRTHTHLQYIPTAIASSHLKDAHLCGRLPCDASRVLFRFASLI